MEKKDIYILHIEKALNDAENQISKINDDILKIHGMTGYKTRHFYNNILNISDARYLEIGMWRGSSICSAMYNNNATIVGIDNFSQFLNNNENMFEILLENVEKFKGINNVKIINENCFTLDILNLPKFNIYMYDGDHEEISHYKALEYYYNALDDIFIYIVDDWNNEPIRNATYKVINDLNLTIVYKKEIFTPVNCTGDWWNGMVVFLLSKIN